MAKNPSTRWFWIDERSDTGLRTCSIGSRGAWHEMLGICVENGGYLLVDGKAPSICELGRLIGVERRQLSRLLRELEKHGVFSRTEEGVIYCRRMVREAGKKCAPHKPQKNARGTDANHPDLFDNPSRARARPLQASSFKREERISVLDSQEGSHARATRAPEPEPPPDEPEVLPPGPEPPDPPPDEIVSFPRWMTDPRYWRAIQGRRSQTVEARARARHDELIRISREAAFAVKRDREMREEAAARRRGSGGGGAAPSGSGFSPVGGLVAGIVAGIRPGGGARPGGHPA